MSKSNRGLEQKELGMAEKETKFAELVGKIILDIQGLEKGSDEVVFVCSDGSKYKMYHSQDCCENVQVEDVYGDLEDLIGEKIVIAEENSSAEGPRLDKFDDSYTWTFYKLATIKGYVDIRWYGTSNGYYSEEVSFVRIVDGCKDKDMEKVANLIQEKYDAFLATQLTLVAKEKGVSVADLCLRHNDVKSNIQKIDGDIKFWVEVK